MINNNWKGRKVLQMQLIRNKENTMDFTFIRQFTDLSSQYREVDEEDPRLLCQASHATVRYINENLPENLEWDNGRGILIAYGSDYDDCEKVELNGREFAVCPEAYEELDALLPDAVKYGLKETFGHARKRK